MSLGNLGDLGNLDVVVDYAAIGAAWSPERLAGSRRNSLWRYLPLLPVDDPGFEDTSLGAAGGTPLYRAERLGAELGLSQLLVKYDGRNPTASFSDLCLALASFTSNGRLAP